MRNKELAATIALVKGLLADPRLESAHQELRKGVRELEKIRVSGKPDLRRVSRAISLVSNAVVKVLPKADPLDHSEASPTD